MGSVVFVHGTGVRLTEYKAALGSATRGLQQAGLAWEVIPCAWGDPLGVDFDGLSLPDPPGEAELQQEALEQARWTWLFEDPYFELNALTIRGDHLDAPLAPPGRKPLWLQEWERVTALSPSLELELLLKRGGLQDDWPRAWAELRASSTAKRAIEISSAENELADAFVALARAAVALMYGRALDAGRQGPDRGLRDAIVERLVEDWGYSVYGLKTFVTDLFSRAATRVLRRRRNKFNALAANPLGDILLYQSQGERIRSFIRAKVEQAEPPVAIVAHSLGGIAAFDLLAMDEPPGVSHLVTIGSQAPYFYEIGALQSLNRPAPLPAHFPPWLNIYDRDDFLSFVGERLFPGRIVDREVHSGRSFPQSHSAYMGNEEVWSAIREFTRP